MAIGPNETLCLMLAMLLIGVHTARAEQQPPASEQGNVQPRTWTDSTGRYQTEAAMIKHVDGKVHLGKEDGGTVVVPVSSLSGADQRYVRQELARRRALEKERPPDPQAATAQRADWPQFRGPGGLATSSDEGLPTRWSSEDNILWKSELPGAGASSPIVLGDRIFLTCHTGYGMSEKDRGSMDELRRHVICLSRQGGKIIWDEEVPTELPEQPYEKRMFAHGYASSTPATDGARLYVFFGKSGVFALDLDGRRLWHADVGSRIHGWGSGASPVVYDDLVIVNASVESESLVALRAQTGEEVWRAEGIRESWNTPLLVDVPGGETELVVAIFGKILGFEPSTGKPLWTCDGIGCYIVPSLVARDGIVYGTGGRQHETVAVRAGGRGDVTATHLLWKANHGSNVSSPVYCDGYLYFVHEQLGIAYCLDGQTGEVAYEERLSPPPGKIYASPVVADGKLYYLAQYGHAFVLAAGPEFELLGHNEMIPDKGPFNASPAATGSQLLLRSDRFLYCIGDK